MVKSELKTKTTEVNVVDYIAALPELSRREDATKLDVLFRNVTGLEPAMWGPSIIGYGSYSYKYESGREGTMCRAGFSPRKGAHVLYVLGGQTESAETAALLARLGKHTHGKGCLYIKKLADVDVAVVEQLVAMSWARMHAQYPD